MTNQATGCKKKEEGINVYIEPIEYEKEVKDSFDRVLTNSDPNLPKYVIFVIHYDL